VHSRPDLEDGILAILDELLDHGHRPIILCEQALGSPNAAPSPKAHVRAVHKNSLRGRYHFLTARTVITTHGVYRPHRRPRRQQIVNIWHGEPLAKPVGHLIGNEAIESSWATTLSSIGKAFRCAEFGLHPDRVLVVGAPRNDRLVRAERHTIRARIACDDTESISVWLPTFRGSTERQRPDGIPFRGMVPLPEHELDELDQWLAHNNSTLLIKPHPTALRSAPLKRYNRIHAVSSDWLATRGLTLYTLLAGVDCLITDASSVWVDFLLTQKPIIFVFPDVEAYSRTRGFNLEPYPEWVPGPLVADGAGLLGELQALHGGKDGYVAARRSAKARFHRYDDDRSSHRVLAAVGLTR